ncbi:serine/threonine-protein kinase, partial [Trebonia sp.]|uniref:serine/threonine-protein kinase n=1 Tax=Trebonia sp. TaxID=2767075 RepID=UPI002601FB91
MDSVGGAAEVGQGRWAVPGYTEVRSLGGGGFGEVVLATHDASGTAVAVKYLRPGLLADPGQAAMFRAEAATLAGLVSPYVVRLYEYVEGPAGAAIVMELVEGVTLAAILEREGKTSPEAALAVLSGSLLGLGAAHARGVVHRDYKPANVLVDGRGASKLTDFGIAALAGDRAAPAGTLVYMPPEQFRGAPASPAGDVYAATVTFYQCLAGRVPFDGATAAELYELHRSAPVPMGPVPAALRPVVARGLAKDPRWRPSDALLLAGQLAEAAAGAYGPDWQERGRSQL